VPARAKTCRVAAVSRASRDKGARIEREIVARHVAIGVKAERVPLSGSARYRGNGCDIDVYAFGADAAPLVGEVKARGNGEGFALLERWLGDADMLFLRRDRAEPFVVVSWRVWARLLS
jgi:Holliday junction resolvase